MAKEEDEVILDNPAVTNMSPVPHAKVVVDQDFRDPTCTEILQKGLGGRWVPGHRARGRPELSRVLGSQRQHSIRRNGQPRGRAAQNATGHHKR